MASIFSVKQRKKNISCEEWDRWKYGISEMFWNVHLGGGKGKWLGAGTEIPKRSEVEIQKHNMSLSHSGVFLFLAKS